jgi:hypothetical protein
VDNFGTVLNTTLRVGSKAVDSGGRIITAGTKAVRISVGAIFRGFQSVLEVPTTKFILFHNPSYVYNKLIQK